ncbi:hypothetical protein [Hyphomonas sp.]|uniref:hypothetical protein n=1 Tax=Hyphomonas sp. TaxID=87 RepID=UPI00391AE57D
MAESLKSSGSARIFLLAFALCSLAGLLAAAAAHAGLARAGLLAPPPYVATWCIDGKLDFLSKTDLETVEVASVGSSATWRNLDMSVVQESLGKPSLNAAPCFLNVDQTAYLTEFLLPRMPQLDTLVTSFIPQDFEGCRPGDAAFFDRQLAGAVFDRRVPEWAPYITGFRPMHLFTYAFQKSRGTGGFGVALHEDGLGSAVFAEPFDWWPDLNISEACYSELTRLEALTRARGVRLVVAIAPIDPGWQADRDPDGKLLSDWRARMRAALPDDVLLVDGGSLNLSSDQFADAMHLLHPNEAAFSRLIAQAILEAEAPAPCAPGDPDGEC